MKMWPKVIIGKVSLLLYNGSNFEGEMLLVLDFINKLQQKIKDSRQVVLVLLKKVTRQNKPRNLMLLFVAPPSSSCPI
jgi:hypothetical protein